MYLSFNDVYIFKSVDTFKQVLGAHKGQGISELYEKAI